MKINGRELVLSPRKTADHFALVETIKREKDLPELLYMAQMINDSLKATYINMTEGIDKLGIWKRYKKLKAAGEYQRFFKGDVNYLIAFLSPQDIMKYSKEITVLDGIDKKKVVEEKQSGETLPED